MSYSATVLTDTPTCYYRLNDAAASTTVVDSSANTYAAATVSASGVTLGVTGVLAGSTVTAGSFDGTAGTITFPTTISPAGWTVLTAELWFKLNNTTYVDNPRIFCNSHTDSDKHGFQVWISGTKIHGAVGIGTNYADANYAPVGGWVAGLWYHVVLTYDGTYPRLYLNGALVGTGGANAGTISASTYACALGYDIAGASDYAPVTVQEVALYNATLSATRISAHYQAGTQLTIAETAAGSEHSVEQLAVADTAGDTERLTQPRTVAETATGLSPAVTGRYAPIVLSDGPLAYYRLEEGAGPTLYDSSGNGHAGTYSTTGLTYSQTGAVIGGPSTAVAFDGAAGYADCGAALGGSATTLSVECWFQAAATTGYPRLVAGGYPDNDDKGFELLFASGTLTFYIGNGTTTAFASSTGAFTLNQWYHAVGTFDGSTIRLYVNGVVSANTGSITGPMVVSTYHTTLGREPAYNGDYFHGVLDEIAIYPTALSGARILAHYQAGTQTTMGATHTGVEHATIGLHLTESGHGAEGIMGGRQLTIADTAVGVTLPGLTPYGSRVVQDGAVAYYPCAELSGTVCYDHSNNGWHATLPADAGTGLFGPLARTQAPNWGFAIGATGITMPTGVNPSGWGACTIEGWMKCTSLTYADNPRLIANAHTDADGTGFQIFMQGHNILVVNIHTSTTTCYLSYPFTPPLNGWVYLAVVYDGTTVRLYLNAQLVASQICTGTLTASTHQVAFGYNPVYAGDAWPGVVTQIALYDTALTTTQIEGHWSAAYPPGTVTIFDTAVGVDLPNQVSAFVTTQPPGRFRVEGRPFSFSGLNVYDLGLQWGYSAANLQARFSQLAAYGVKVVRCWFFSESNVASNPPPNVLQYGTTGGLWNETAFVQLDMVINAAEVAGIYLIACLSNNWGDYGGKPQYVNWYNTANATALVADNFHDTAGIETLFKAYINHLLTRTNTITGRTYVNEPAILGWELMNEGSYQLGTDTNANTATSQRVQTYSAWMSAIASYIRSLDVNHLIGSGGISKFYDYIAGDPVHNGTYGGLDYINQHAAYCDWFSYHLYPANGYNSNGHGGADCTLIWPSDGAYHAQITQYQTIAAGYNKPCVIGEVGIDKRNTVTTPMPLFPRSTYYTDLLAETAANNYGGVLFWDYNADEYYGWFDTGNVYPTNTPPANQSDANLFLLLTSYNGAQLQIGVQDSGAGITAIVPPFIPIADLAIGLERVFIGHLYASLALGQLALTTTPFGLGEQVGGTVTSSSLVVSGALGIFYQLRPLHGASVGIHYTVVGGATASLAVGYTLVPANTAFLINGQPVPIKPETISYVYNDPLIDLNGQVTLQGFMTMTWNWSKLLDSEMAAIMALYSPSQPQVTLTYPNERGFWVTATTYLLPPALGSRATVTHGNVSLSFIYLPVA